MLDLTAFAQTTDQRFIESTRAGGIKNPRVGKLGNFGEPSKSRISGSVVDPDRFVRPNNSDGQLVFVSAIGSFPALAFFADWNSGASFVFTRWQFGPSTWTL